METHGNPQRTAVIGGDADHPEKTSVFKRVRNKARKIKDTLTSRGHSQENEEKGDHPYNELGSEEGSEEAAEIQGDPLHEARREEGGVIDGKSQASRENYPVKKEDPEAFRGGDEISGKLRGQFENISPSKQHPHTPKMGREEEKAAAGNYETKVSDPTPSVDEWRREERGENFSEKNKGLDAFGGGDEISEKSRVQMGNISPVVEDLHSPKTERGLGNYETKVSDPARSVYESRREEGDVIDEKSHESYTVKNAGPDAFRGEDEISGKSGVQFENLSPMEEDMHSPKKGRGEKAAPENYVTNDSDPTRSEYESKIEEGNVIDGKSQASHENYPVKNEDQEAFRGGDEIFENSREQFEKSSPMEEDLRSPKMGRGENAAPEIYETRVPEPTSSVYESRREEGDVIDEKSQATPENEAFRGGDEFFEKSRAQIENFPVEDDLRGGNGAPENYETEVSDPNPSVYESKREEGDVIDEKSQANRENYTVENEGPEAFRGGDEISEKSRVQFENSSSMEEDPHSPKMGTGEKKAAPENYETQVSDPTRSVYESRREEGDVIDEKSQASRGDYMVENEGPEAFSGGDEISGKSRVQSGNLSPSEENPQSPETGRGPENYETEVSGPTRSGGDEEGVEPLAHDFEALKVSDDRHPTSDGSHIQFSPDDNQKSPEKPPKQGSYADTVYSATSVITGKAMLAKNAVASKLGYGQGTEPGVPETQDNNQEEKEAGVTPSSAGGYGQKIKESIAPVIAPVYGKVAEVQGSGKEEVKVDETEGGVKRSSEGVPVSEFVAQKLRPGEEDKALSEVISGSIRKPKEESEGQQVDAAPASASPSMVGRIRGAVTSMFSKAETHPLPQDPSRERGEVGADKEAHGAT